MQKVWQLSGVKPKELDIGEIDSDLEYIWPLYWELYPFSYQNIQAWSELTGNKLKQWELILLNRLSRAINGAV